MKAMALAVLICAKLTAFTLPSWAQGSYPRPAFSFSLEEIFSLLGPRACAPPQVQAPDQAPLSHLEFRRLMADRRPCEAFERAYGQAIARQDAVAAVQALEASLAGGDYVGTISSALALLRELPQLQGNATFRHGILRAVEAAIRLLGERRDPRLLRMALGIHPESKERLRPVSFAAYLEDFPVAAASSTVETVLRALRLLYIKQELYISETLSQQSQYAGAINRLAALYSFAWLRETGERSTVVYAIGMAQVRFVEAIRAPAPLFDDHPWPNWRIGMIFKRPQGEPIDRNEAIRTIAANARENLRLLLEMEGETQRAQNLRNEMARARLPSS